jgi:hypothetical protein
MLVWYGESDSSSSLFKNCLCAGSSLASDGSAADHALLPRGRAHSAVEGSDILNGEEGAGEGEDVDSVKVRLSTDDGAKEDVDAADTSPSRASDAAAAARSALAFVVMSASDKWVYDRLLK